MATHKPGPCAKGKGLSSSGSLGRQGSKGGKIGTKAVKTKSPAGGERFVKNSSGGWTDTHAFGAPTSRGVGKTGKAKPEIVSKSVTQKKGKTSAAPKRAMVISRTQRGKKGPGKLKSQKMARGGKALPIPKQPTSSFRFKAARSYQTSPGNWQLLEVRVLGTPNKIDAEAGILYGVKILGTESQNGRRYTLSAIRKAAALYENCNVNIDHPTKPTESRSALDRFAWLENVQVKNDGLYGDLHILDVQEPFARKLLAAAAKHPESFGLSHNAQGTGKTVDGVFVVEDITEVRHVDLVADPATTKSLYESRTRTMRTAKQVFEALAVKHPKAAPLVVRLIEMGDEDPELPLGDTPMEEPPPDEAPEEGDWKAHVVAGIAAAIDAGDMESAKALMRILEKDAAPEEPVPEEEGDEEEEGGDEEETEETEESLKRTVAELQAKDHCRELCEEIGVQPGKTLLKALIYLDSDAERKELIEQHRVNGHRNGKPRSASPGRPLAMASKAVLESKPADWAASLIE